MAKRSAPPGAHKLTPDESSPGRHLLPAADLAAEIERLKEQLSEERERHLRTLADFKNYRRRQESEGQKIAASGKREIILALLDVIDDLERSLGHEAGAVGTLADGVRLIHRKILALLEAQGVRPFESVGKMFTPDLHEAVAVKKDRRAEPGTVVDELRKGYLWNDALLRPAQVRVAE